MTDSTPTPDPTAPDSLDRLRKATAVDIKALLKAHAETHRRLDAIEQLLREQGRSPQNLSVGPAHFAGPPTHPVGPTNPPVRRYPVGPTDPPVRRPATGEVDAKTH